MSNDLPLIGLGAIRYFSSTGLGNRTSTLLGGGFVSRIIEGGKEIGGLHDDEYG